MTVSVQDPVSKIRKTGQEKLISSPLVIAHRGSQKKFPENSMAAFAQAARDGADGIELDIFLTADRKVVVIHDENTKRLTGAKLVVRKSLYRELKTLDLGKQQKIPLLDEVLGNFAVFSRINVEIKSTGLKSDGIEGELALLLKRHRLNENILVSSFNPFNLSRFKKIRPDVAIATLLTHGQSLQKWYLRSIAKIDPAAINPEFSILKSRNSPLDPFKKPLWIWNANDENAWKICVNHPRVAAIIVDEPDKLKCWLTNSHCGDR